MLRFRHAASALIVSLATLSSAGLAAADLARLWTPQELSAFATLIVTGRVIDVSSQWDPAVNGLYTYATIDVDETWKGPRPAGPIVVKMLGGRVADIEMRVDGQAQLAIGQSVALWLETRPRDRHALPRRALARRVVDRARPWRRGARRAAWTGWPGLGPCGARVAAKRRSQRARNRAGVHRRPV